ncbi:putative membrane protein YphA (DoxX/SURF4 family) [Aurantimicrobium minutum]|uniref:DoxX family protein n=1 Tax=Aurantimicrobium minutum TaxID=708131 RepID=UPI002475B6DC|nr:DoxX family protein [Aurantimicrobium minutum]MDH6531908.1 putative membrane protein YphA (DoxX/SURF4 family) [Aurantimicrobium minutum]
MVIALSILNVLLALVFVFAGATKAFQPIEKLAVKMPWVNDFSTRNVRLIGWAELLGGMGLVLPGTVGLGILQLVAAVCLAILMIGAAIWHLRQKDTKGAIPSIVLAVLLAVVALFMVA